MAFTMTQTEYQIFLSFLLKDHWSVPIKLKIAQTWLLNFAEIMIYVFLFVFSLYYSYIISKKLPECHDFDDQVLQHMNMCENVSNWPNK